MNAGSDGRKGDNNRRRSTIVMYGKHTNVEVWRCTDEGCQINFSKSNNEEMQITKWKNGAYSIDVRR